MTVDGDSSETELVTKKNGKQKSKTGRATTVQAQMV